MPNSNIPTRAADLSAKAPEVRPLRLAAGCAPADLSKPQVMVQTTAGDSHPGSVHLARLSRQACNGLFTAGLAPLEYTCTDICDGIAQGTAGMRYSLIYREALSYVTECQVHAGHFDGLLFSASCDKAVPGHLLALARLDRPSVFLPGGVMGPGLGGFLLNQAGEIYAAQRRLAAGVIDADTYAAGLVEPAHADFVMSGLCPGPGCCAFLGTAGTMQIMTEALGIAPWHSALCPAGSSYQDHIARRAGELLAGLVKAGTTFSTIVSEAALRNAIIVHAAIGGSSNAVLHLLALAGELGYKLDIDAFQQAAERTPFLLDIVPSGRHPANLFWHLGGVPMLLDRLAPLLDTDVLTCQGQSLGDMLAEYQGSGAREAAAYAFQRQFGLAVDEVLRPLNTPLQSRGALTILRGNLAPGSAVVKRTALTTGSSALTCQARVFDSSDAALEAILAGRIPPFTAIVIRYEGPKGNGMPEQFYLTEALVSDPELAATTMLITDGRFSGASRGPAIGHVSPEAVEGGPIALVADGDLIRLDLVTNRLDIVGAGGEALPAAAVVELLANRRKAWTGPPADQGKPARGIFALYRKLAASADRGGAMLPPGR